MLEQLSKHWFPTSWFLCFGHWKLGLATINTWQESQKQLWRSSLVIFVFFVIFLWLFLVEKRLSKYHHNDNYSNISGNNMFRNTFKVLPVFCFKRLFRYCLNGLIPFCLKKTTAVFPGGSKKRKSNNDDKHGRGQEQGDPQHYVEGQIWKKG